MKRRPMVAFAMSAISLAGVACDPPKDLPTLLATFSEPVPASTTTTTPLPTTTTTTSTTVPPYESGQCGGDLPPCWVMVAESGAGGNPTAMNHTGCGGRGCWGKWQFDPRTWAGFGGYENAHLAPEEVQDEKARQLWAGGRGCSHWAAC